MISDDLVWICHVCGRTRPDHKISVHKKESSFGGTEVVLTQNVRYCNDDEQCRKGAEGVSFLGT